MQKRAFLTSLLFLAAITASNAQLQTGEYDGQLYIVRTLKHDRSIIRGYYYDSIGRDGWISTIFFLKGIQRMRGDTIIPIVTFYPGDGPKDSIRGRFEGSAEGRLYLDACPGGSLFGDCPKPRGGSMERYRLERRHHWRALSYVRARKTPIFSRANDNFVTRAYVVKNDCVAISSENGKWFEGDYISRYGPRHGWFKKSALEILK